MKITIAVPGRWHAFDLAGELHKQGHLFRVITTYPKSRTRAFGIPDDKVISFVWMIYFERVVQKCFGGDIWRKHFADRHMRVFSYLAARHLQGSDLVHGWAGSAERIFKRAKQLRIPCVLERSSSHMRTQCDLLRAEYESYGMEWTETSPNGVERELREYRLAEQIFVPSKFVWESFEQHDFPIEKLFKSSFGVNLDKFKYERESFNTDQPLNCIFTSARGVRKGIRYLAEAFKPIKANQARLVMVGGQEVGIEAFLPQGENVEIHNHVAQGELLAFYRQADVFIHPSIEEGLSMVQAQALAAGLALICTTNTGGEDLLMLSGCEPEEIEEGILQYPAGFVVPSHNAESIRYCVERLSADRELLESMQIEALALCESGNSWSHYAKRNADGYATIINKLSAA